MVMEDMVSKTFMKVIGFAGCILLTLFAGLFGLLSVSAFIMSIIDRSLIDVVACVAAGLIGLFCWSIRKDTLV